MSTEDRSFASQTLPFLITVFSGLVTVQWLYTFTNQRELLVVIFLIIYGIAWKIRSYVTVVLYPERPDGVEIRRTYIATVCDLIATIAQVIITKLLIDEFTSVRMKLDMQWYYLLVAMTTLIVLAISFIKHLE